MSDPWYRRTVRWGQTNLTEIEPLRYDGEFWRAHWQRTEVGGLIVNAGGIVAQYPSAFAFQRRAQGIEDRDLLREVVADARSQGLSVIARMDSNRADERFYRQYPEWFCVSADGRPIRAGEKYITCINSGYYRDYLPAVFREIIDHVRPDGFADNSWAGLHRSEICYCESCKRGFFDATGTLLPLAHDASDDVFRAWITWSYELRTELWRANNAVTRAAGGAHCLWIGMVGGDMGYNRERFVDVRAIAKETPLLLLDHQRRLVPEGFAQNVEVGLRVASLAGVGGRYAEAMPMYQLGGPVFRLSAVPQAEARLWMTAGIAGGTMPWWHHIGSRHDDRRQYETAAPVFRWHRDNERYLLDRTAIVGVGVVWSRANNDLAEGDEFEDRIASPYRGVWQALVRARIPYIPVHIDDIETLPAAVKTLILPELVVLSDPQIDAVRSFVTQGGALVVTGETSLRDEHGDVREGGGLGDLLGVRMTKERVGGVSAADDDFEIYDRHSYLRLDGDPRPRWEPLRRLGDTDIVAFGGQLTVVEPVDVDAVPLRFIPPFPIYPPETAWMREPEGGHPALTIREATNGRGRVAYLAADIDRCWGRDQLPDHADILAAVVEWASGEAAPVRVTGRGHICVTPWRSGADVVIHLSNVTATTRRAGREGELVPSGDLRVVVDAALVGAARARVRALVGGWSLEIEPISGGYEVHVPPVYDHEVLVLEVISE